MSTIYLLCTVPSTSHILTHLIFIISLYDIHYYYPSFQMRKLKCMEFKWNTQDLALWKSMSQVPNWSITFESSLLWISGLLITSQWFSKGDFCTKGSYTAQNIERQKKGSPCSLWFLWVQSFPADLIELKSWVEFEQWLLDMLHIFLLISLCTWVESLSLSTVPGYTETLLYYCI